MILISQIDLGIRARSSLSNIPALAEDISTKGLISPILLTRKTSELITEYEEFYKIRLDPSRPFLLNCGGRRFAAIVSLGSALLYPGISCDLGKYGYILRENTGLLDLLLIEGRENRNRIDLDWRDDMKLIVSAYRLAKQQANLEGEYLVMKDFACLLGVSHTHLGIAERIYDDYLSDPESYRDATSVYDALTLSIKKVGNVATKVLLYRQLNDKPIIREVKPEGGDIYETTRGPANTPSTQPDSGPAKVSPSVGLITIPLSQAFFNQEPRDFLSQQPKGFCDHIVTQVTIETLNYSIDLLKFFFAAISEHGYLVIFVPTHLFFAYLDSIEEAGFSVQLHPLIWNKIDYRYPIRGGDQHNFAQSYETCLLARKPGSILAQAQNASIYTCSHKAREATFGPGYIPPEVYSWVLRGIAIQGQVIYDPFARTGASAIGTLNVKCRPIGTESDENKFGKLLSNLKDYYTKQLPSVQFT